MTVEIFIVLALLAAAAWAGYRIGFRHGWRDAVDYSLKLDGCTECGGSMRTPATHDTDCPNRPVGPIDMVAYGPEHPEYPNEPSDWDGGRIKTRSGAIYLHENYPGRWKHHGGSMDIMKYKQYPAEFRR